MTKQDTTEPAGKAAERARLDEIAHLYEGMRDLLTLQIETASGDAGLAPKVLIARLTDLQAAQLLLMKAEEKFRESFGPEDVEEDPGAIAKVRAEIGRKIDRLRDSVRTKRVSEKPE